MSHVHTVVCVLKTPSGVTTVPMKHYDDAAVAERAKMELETGFNDLLATAKIIVPTDQGPRVLMPLSQFLGQLCIAGVGYVVAKGEVHGAVVLEPRSQLIVPGRN